METTMKKLRLPFTFRSPFQEEGDNEGGALTVVEGEHPKDMEVKEPRPNPFVLLGEAIARRSPIEVNVKVKDETKKAHKERVQRAKARRNKATGWIGGKLKAARDRMPIEVRRRQPATS